MGIKEILRSDRHMREVLRGASIAFVTKALGAGLTFLFNMYLARVLGAGDVGIFFLALTATNIATVFGRMGLDHAMLRFVSANAATRDWVALKGANLKSLAFALGASSGCALIFFSLAPWIAESFLSKPELAYPMRWMTLSVVPVTLLVIHAEMLKGLKRILESTLMQEHGVVFSSLLLGGMLFFGKSSNLAVAVWVFNGSALLAALLAMLLWWRATPEIRGIKGRFKTKDLLNSSLPLLAMIAMNLASYWIPSILLGKWRSSADVGVYNVAVQIGMLTSFILISVNSVVAPKFSELFALGDMEGLGRLARNSTKFMTVLASPVLLALLVFPGWVMSLVGPEFAAGGSVLAIIACGQFVNVATGSVGYLLIMSRNERLIGNTVVFSAILNFGISMALIPYTGIVGAAIATALCLAVRNLISAYLVWNRLRIQTIPFDLIGFGRMKDRSC